MTKLGPPFPLYWIEEDWRSGPSGEPTHLMEVDHAFRGDDLVYYCDCWSPPWVPAVMARIGETVFQTPEQALEDFQRSLVVEIQNMPRRLAESQPMVDGSLLKLQQAEALVELVCSALGLTEKPAPLDKSRLRFWPLGPRPVTLYYCEILNGRPYIRERQFEEDGDKLFYIDETGARGFHYKSTLKGGLSRLRFSPASAVDALADSAREWHQDRLRSHQQLEDSLKAMKSDLALCERGIAAFPRVVERAPGGRKRGTRPKRLPERLRKPKQP